MNRLRLIPSTFLVGTSVFAHLVWVLPGSGHADTPAFQLDIPTTDLRRVSFRTFGGEFTVSTDVLVTHLGFVDAGAPGLVDVHQVGLWSVDGTLLSSATVDPDTVSEVDDYRYEPIDGVPLSSGESYVIGSALTFSPSHEFDLAPSVFDPVPSADEIDYIIQRFSRENAFVFPEFARGVGAAIGANFLFRVVPEPGSMMLVLVAIAGVMLTHRRSTACR